MTTVHVERPPAGPTHEPFAQESPGLLQQLASATQTMADTVMNKAHDVAAAAGAAVSSGVSSGEGDERQGDPAPAGSQPATPPASPTEGSAHGRPAPPSLPETRPPAPAKLPAEQVPASGRSYFPVVGKVTECPRPGRVTAQPYKGSTSATKEGPTTPHPPAGRSAGQTHGQDEDWISELVECLWPFVRGAIEDQAMQMLPDILEANEPSWIHDLSIKKFALGNKEPDLSNIKVWKDENDLMDDTFLEFDFVWESEQDVVIEIQTLPADFNVAILPNFIERKIADLLNFSVGVERAVLKGSVRLTLRPLFKRLPVVGAIQVALVEQPEFDFDLKIGDSTDVPMEPQLKNWLKQTMREAVFASYVLPEHYFYSLDPEAEDIDKPTGVLVAKVIEAKHVPKMDLLSFSSPYLTLYVRNSQRRQTTTKNNTKHPRWGETFELPVHVPEHQELRATLWDYDWGSPDDEIGRVSLPLSELEPNKTQDMWLDIKDGGEEEYQAGKHEMKHRDRAKMAVAKPFLHQGGAKRCKLHMELTYYTFSQAEQDLIARGSQQGMEQMLASPEGRQLNPHLRKLVLGGVLRATVSKAEHLDLGRGIFGRPSVKATIRAGKEEKSLAAAKANRSGCVEWGEQVEELHIDADDRHKQGAVTVEVEKAGWLNRGSIGSVQVPLQEVISRGRIARTYPLAAGGRSKVHVTLEWKPYF